MRGAFTFAVGPSPGPPPQFVIPSLGESAATPSLVGSRWVLLLAVLASVGLLAFRAVIARPLQVEGGSERALRSVTIAAGDRARRSRSSPRPSISCSRPPSSR